jgi:hypothetical protein
MLPKVEFDRHRVNRRRTEFAVHEEMPCNFAAVSAGRSQHAASLVLRVYRFLEDCKLQQIFLRGRA